MMDKHGKLFNKIASYYQLFFKYQVWYYNKIIEKKLYLFNKDKINTILDIGCGTGAFGYVFMQKGFSVKGVDVAPKMVKKGLKNDIYCETGDIKEGLKYDNNSFDMVTSSMVAHGLGQNNRIILYKEAKRIAKYKVLIQDYKFQRKIFVDFIEWLEGGGYFNFIENGKTQLESIFDDLQIIEVSRNLNWYIFDNIFEK